MKEIKESVKAQLVDQLGNNFKPSMIDNLTTKEILAQNSNAIYGSHEAGWLSFYDAMNEFGIDTSSLNGMSILAKNAGWFWTFQDVAIITDRPIFIKRDDRNLLHAEDGPALAYADGFAVYSWHGTRIPAEWIEDKANLKPETALTWENIEQRRAACEILGWARVLRELNAKVINTDGDPEIGELIEVDLPDAGKERFLRVLCGTGREFALPVPPEMKTALEAQAWTWGLDKKSFVPPEVRT